VKKQSFLEELDIYHCFYIEMRFFHCIGKCCPLLKSLKFIPSFEQEDKDDNVVFAIAKTMPGLCQLMILNNELTNDGLVAILDGCPLLESLDLRGCLHLNLDESLEKRCIEKIKEFRFPGEYIDPFDSIIGYIRSLCPKFTFFESINYDQLSMLINAFY